MEQKIFIKNKERVYPQFFFNIAHDGIEFITGFIKVDMVPFAAEKCRC